MFRDLRTQWRWTNGVRVGLDYSVLYAKLAHRGMAGDEVERIEADVRVMEFAALSMLAERREREAQMRKR